MSVYKKLEELGLFSWLKDTHELADNIITPEYLDTLNVDDIHITVINSCAFRWFREKHNLSFSSSQRKTSGLTYWEIVFVDKFEDAMHGSPSYSTDTKISGINSTYYLAEQEGLEKMINLVTV